MSEAEHLRQRQKEMRALEHRFFALSSSRLFSRIASGFKSCKDTPFDERSYRSNDAFYARYPIVTSSTNSLCRCAPEAKLFDYLIIDEASQVSLPAAALCLAHAANAVIVGDSKQLPAILQTDGPKPDFSVDPAWDATRFSLLDAVIDRYGRNLSMPPPAGTLPMPPRHHRFLQPAVLRRRTCTDDNA